MSWLWPIVTGKTFFDTSSVIHLAFWIFAGSGPAYVRMNLTAALAACLFWAMVWEVVEMTVCEPHWPKIWLHPEGPLNRWVSDPLMCVVGVLIAYWLVKHQ